MDTTRTQLKTLNTQFHFFMQQKVSWKNNLISLLDLTYPGANALFDSLFALTEAKNGLITSILSGMQTVFAKLV